MTVRVELAAALHLSAFKGAGPETHDAPRSQKTVNSREEAVFFELYDEDTAGLRPTGLVEPPGPQERVPRHTVEQMADVAPMVQILDAPVPQLVDKLEDVLKIVDLFVPVQEIGVPKIIKPFPSSSSPGSSCAADGGTAGGCARTGRHTGTWQVRPWRQMVPDRYAGVGGATGGWLALAMFSGAARRDSPPAQGGI